MVVPSGRSRKRRGSFRPSAIPPCTPPRRRSRGDDRWVPERWFPVRNGRTFSIERVRSSAAPRAIRDRPLLRDRAPGTDRSEGSLSTSTPTRALDETLPCRKRAASFAPKGDAVFREGLPLPALEIRIPHPKSRSGALRNLVEASRPGLVWMTGGTDDFERVSDAAPRGHYQGDLLLDRPPIPGALADLYTPVHAPELSSS